MSSLRVVLMTVVLAGSVSVCHAQTMNQSVANFLHGKIGHRVGGGECAQAVSEALRVSNAAFTPYDLGPDSPGPGDNVWGTLVKIISATNGRWSDSNPSAPVMRGDVLQYHNVTIVLNGGTFTADIHTSVAGTVDANGMPTYVLEQNVNGNRHVSRDLTDLTKLSTGWIRIYRPIPRVDSPGRYQISIVNHAPTTQTFTAKYGNQTVGTFNLSPINTTASYEMILLTASQPVNFTLVTATGSSILVYNESGYVIRNTGTIDQLPR